MENQEKKLKMYILIKAEIPLGFAMVSVAHASLACYFEFKETEEVKQWLSGKFYKVVCKVSKKEFEKAKEYEDRVILKESALENEEVAIAFKPRLEWPKSFRFYQLYKE